MSNMVKLGEVLDFCRMREFKLNQDIEDFLSSLDTFFGKQGRVNEIYFYENQVEIFIKFLKRYGLPSDLFKELRLNTEPIELCFINDFDNENMLYTYSIANYSSNVLLLDIIPVIEMNKPLG